VLDGREGHDGDGELCSSACGEEWYTRAMNDAIVHVPDAVNEPIHSYAPGTPERSRLKAALHDVEREVVEIPCVVGGQRITTGKLRDVSMPHRHRHVIAPVSRRGCRRRRARDQGRARSEARMGRDALECRRGVHAHAPRSARVARRRAATAAPFQRIAAHRASLRARP